MAIDTCQDRQQETESRLHVPLQAMESSHLIAGDALLREAIYAFFSSLYLQPVAERTLQQMCNVTFLAELAEILSGNGVSELRGYLARQQMAVDKDELAALEQEYMNLFCVPTGQYVSPFEDIYRGKTADGQSQHGPLLGVRAIAAKRLYRSAGAHFDANCKNLPNHVGVELAFMQFLCGREASAIQAGDTLKQQEKSRDEFSEAEVYRAYQVRFLSEHLSDWFPQLNEAIQNKSRHVFYRAIADMTQAFLQQDLARLKQRFSDSLQ